MLIRSKQAKLVQHKYYQDILSYKRNRIFKSVTRKKKDFYLYDDPFSRIKDEFFLFSL